MIKALIFDIGGVFLIPDISPAIFEKFAEAIGVPPEKFMALHARYFDRMLVGKVSANQFFALVKKEFAIKKDINAIKKIWIAVVAKELTVNKQLLKVVEKLRAQYPVIVLSNVTENRGLIDEHFGLYAHFDRVFLSHAIKTKKPAKGSYRYVLKKMKFKPDEVLFVDDRESNLKAARELGIKCIQFNNNAQLVTEFKRLGLL